MALLGWLYFTVRELRPGGVLHERGEQPRRRKSVAEMLAEDEADEAEGSGLSGGPRLQHHASDRGVAG
jgi:hypothetical protein